MSRLELRDLEVESGIAADETTENRVVRLRHVGAVVRVGRSGSGGRDSKPTSRTRALVRALTVSVHHGNNHCEKEGKGEKEKEEEDDKKGGVRRRSAGDAVGEERYAFLMPDTSSRGVVLAALGLAGGAM
ncbi:hypothetical protein HK104_005453 [Borealophlyctis nickersoniae]|nr:hypothetical protein HK104_005453 [Borealophlyctis nickersoniae]